MSWLDTFFQTSGTAVSEFTPPPKTGWSWLNQGGATVDESGNAIVLTTPAENHYNLRVRSRAFGATKTVVAAFAGFTTMTSAASGFPECGVGWTDGTKYVTISLTLATYFLIEVHKFNTVTSQNSVVTVFKIPFGAEYPCWIKFTDNGVNRIAYYSPDAGEHWVNIYQETRTTFMTATNNVFLAGAGGGFATTACLRQWVDS